ncbi:hypothetical protein QTP86_028047 [Hemibagrus guttatus]|nr:hypothetical protein QTP86_028047 [Hemibagrus guttatus]
MAQKRNSKVTLTKLSEGLGHISFAYLSEFFRVTSVMKQHLFILLFFTVIKGKKQIARVKVQSNQDVNDPAVKAAILDKVGLILCCYIYSLFLITAARTFIKLEFFRVTSVMKQHLFILLFFTGVLPLTQAIYRRFHLNLQGKTWSNAQAYCRAMYTDLATVENQYESVRLQNIAQSQSCTASTWIGLYNDVNSWRWSMGNEPLGSFRSWCCSNPDNWAAIENCAAVDVTGWFDSSCASTFPFICFDGKELIIF